jgi:hypothetical protein
VTTPISRRSLLAHAARAAALLALPGPLAACRPRGGTDDPATAPPDPDHERLAAWAGTLRREGLAGTAGPLGRATARVGELAAGTPYVAFTLEEYLKAGGSPAEEPLALSLTRFDCVTLVEACLATARAAAGEPSWERFGREVERMRYRGGERRGYASRLHYFSEWISDGGRRGLEHRGSYAALADDGVFGEIGEIERGLDARPRQVIPTSRIPEVADRIETGDVLAFATGIPGLDVSHAAFAYRDATGVLRVLHAPLSGGVVEVTRTTLPEYVAAIRRGTGILVARPLWG